MAISKLAKITNTHKAEVENAIMVLSGDYSANKRGFSLIKKDDQVQLATNPENAEYVSQLVKGELRGSLSQAALEVVSIIAYRGPLTRAEIEAIRGVNSTYTLRNLLMRALVERIENPKDARGYLYQISFDFLKALGLQKVADLPDFENLSKDERAELIIKNAET